MSNPQAPQNTMTYAINRINAITAGIRRLEPEGLNRMVTLINQVSDVKDKLKQQVITLNQKLENVQVDGLGANMRNLQQQEQRLSSAVNELYGLIPQSSVEGQQPQAPAQAANQQATQQTQGSASSGEPNQEGGYNWRALMKKQKSSSAKKSSKMHSKSKSKTKSKTRKSKNKK